MPFGKWLLPGYHGLPPSVTLKPSELPNGQWIGAKNALLVIRKADSVRPTFIMRVRGWDVVVFPTAYRADRETPRRFSENQKAASRT